MADPRIDGWLSKYLVKKTDNKLLIYPKKNTTIADYNRDLEKKEGDVNDSTEEDLSTSLIMEQANISAVAPQEKRKTILEKQRYIQLLEHILEHRLKKRLKINKLI